MAEYREAVTFAGDWIVRDGEKIIAEFSCKNVSEQEARKNAHQFAAASEMYEALKFVKSVMITNGITETSERIAIEKIEAALAKAEDQEV